MWGKKKRQEKNLYGDFVVIFPCCSAEVKNELKEILEMQKRPEWLGGKEVMKNLNLITYGQLDRLSRVTEEQDVAVEVLSILLDFTQEEVYAMDVNEVFGFLYFVKREVKKINDAFDRLKIDHTSEEKAAGIESLSFGSFGILDWYCKRMGMRDQNKVNDIPWIRIYNCIKMDNAVEEYNRRLQEIYANKLKNNGKR